MSSKWKEAREAADAIISAGSRLAYCTMARDWCPMGAEIDDIKAQVAKLETFLDDPYEEDDDCIHCGTIGRALNDDGLCGRCELEAAS